jgi:hypothetical protein
VIQENLGGRFQNVPLSPDWAPRDPNCISIVFHSNLDQNKKPDMETKEAKSRDQDEAVNRKSGFGEIKLKTKRMEIKGRGGWEKGTYSGPGEEFGMWTMNEAGGRGLILINHGLGSGPAHLRDKQ